MITLINPYYDNPGMLEIQYKEWSSYSDDLKTKLRIIIVDDGSPNSPAVDVPRPEGLPSLQIFRVTIDKPWHQHAARNIGAHEAESIWLFLTDIDHVVPANVLEIIIDSNIDNFYTVNRVDAPDMKPRIDSRTGLIHNHPNTFAITKELFWKIGGYDEDFCGIYGTDGLFRSKLFKAAKRKHLEDAFIIRYSRDVQSDASTTTLQRKENRNAEAKRKVTERKRRDGTLYKSTVLTMPYMKVFP